MFFIDAIMGILMRKSRVISREFSRSALNNTPIQIHNGNVIHAFNDNGEDGQTPRAFSTIRVSPVNFIATAQIFDVFLFHGITLLFAEFKSTN
jgi:hypothetical protein